MGNVGSSGRRSSGQNCNTRNAQYGVQVKYIRRGPKSLAFGGKHSARPHPHTPPSTPRYQTIPNSRLLGVGATACRPAAAHLWTVDCANICRFKSQQPTTNNCLLVVSDAIPLVHSGGDICYTTVRVSQIPTISITPIAKQTLYHSLSTPKPPVPDLS